MYRVTIYKCPITIYRIYLSVKTFDDSYPKSQLILMMSMVTGR